VVRHAAGDSHHLWRHERCALALRELGPLNVILTSSATPASRLCRPPPSVLKRDYHSGIGWGVLRSGTSAVQAFLERFVLPRHHDAVRDRLELSRQFGNWNGIDIGLIKGVEPHLISAEDEKVESLVLVFVAAFQT
jgi:hypothetical protein